MIDYNDSELLKRLKKEYDETLKRGYLKMGNGFFDGDFPYSPKYPLYFKKVCLRILVKQMRKSVYLAYKKGAGHELDEGPKGIPPKFLSIGSSSRFCFVSLDVYKYIGEKEGADYFSHDGERIKRTYFEKKLPIFDDDSIPPHMDAYAKTSKREYFFECKCHEMFDEHPLELSKKYFGTGKDLVVDHIPSEYLHKKGNGMIVIDPEAFGLKEVVFDVKQLLTHLMGIVCNKTRKNCDLIYFYSFPREKDIEDPRIKEVIEKVKEDAIKVFESNIIKDYCLAHNITLRFYAYDGHGTYAADKTLVHKIY